MSCTWPWAHSQTRCPQGKWAVLNGFISACAVILASLKLEQHLTVWWSNTRAISSRRHSLGAEWHRPQLRFPMPANMSTAGIRDSAGFRRRYKIHSTINLFQMLHVNVGSGTMLWNCVHNLTTAWLLFWGKTYFVQLNMWLYKDITWKIAVQMVTHKCVHVHIQAI